ncbi:unnamed protein product [Brassicogethes aeneus]|uniref:Neuroendocrine protein 7B2 n=1 Tax=Brassicogethes aeneus TaxID=1431903 RepID=A0A9P0BCJ4_BRAAE|nr:unnamed protein product [Brassicogethes aeneus]
MKLAVIMWLVTGAFCYAPAGKESLLSGIFLRDLVNRLNSNKMNDMSYLDLTDGLSLDERSLTGGLEGERIFPLDYESLGDIAMHPSIRDQEMLQHSSLWGNKFGSGNDFIPSDVAKNRHEVKTDTLPAYCNPPNPCPVGYTGENGCLEDFENTASYSRRYQSSQDCMCDTEHMFDCPNNTPIMDDSLDQLDNMEFNRFIQHSLTVNPAFEHKSLVAKKYHGFEENARENPFLTGEKLPVAAKKGNKVLIY